MRTKWSGIRLSYAAIVLLLAVAGDVATTNAERTTDNPGLKLMLEGKPAEGAGALGNETIESWSLLGEAEKAEKRGHKADALSFYEICLRYFPFGGRRRFAALVRSRCRNRARKTSRSVARCWRSHKAGEASGRDLGNGPLRRAGLAEGVAPAGRHRAPE